MKKIIYISLCLIAFSCKKETGRIINETARYQVTINLNWNSTDFPNSYPANAHFSKFIGWNHQPNTTFFKVGTMASTGIKNMAELGSISPLDSEIITKIENEEGMNLLLGNNLPSGVGQFTFNVDIDKKYSSVSLGSMLAPSPDWYVGAIDVNLLEMGEFVKSKTTNLSVYDAGTDDGTTFASPNMVSLPQQPITLLVDTPLGNGTALSPVIGSINFILIKEL